MSEHCLMFVAEIDQRVATTMVSYLVDLQRSGATKLTVAVSSPGGNVVAGITIYNALLAMPFEVVTHNFGNVDSIANVVFLAGHSRYSNSTSTFMFHGVGFNGNAAERLEEKNLLEKLDVITAEHTRISNIISSRSSLANSDALELFKHQTTKDAAWAKAMGLIHDIREFSVPVGSDLKHLV